MVDSLRDRVAVLRSGASQDVEDQQVEGALQSVVRVFRHINSQLCIAGLAILTSEGRCAPVEARCQISDGAVSKAEDGDRSLGHL